MCRTYDEFVSLYLQCDWAEVVDRVHAADGVAIGVGAADVPPDWIDLVTDDPVERVRWRNRQLKRGL